MKPETRETLTMLFDVLTPAEKGQVFTSLSNFILTRMGETIRAETTDAGEVGTDEIIFLFARVTFEEKYSVILDALLLLDQRQAVPAAPTVTSETPAAPRHEVRAAKTMQLSKKARKKPAKRQVSKTTPDPTKPAAPITTAQGGK